MTAIGLVGRELRQYALAKPLARVEQLAMCTADKPLCDRVSCSRANGSPWDIAAIAHAALTRPGYEGKIYTLTEPAAISTRDQVEAITAELGRPLRVVDVPIEQARAGMVSGGVPAIIAARRDDQRRRACDHSRRDRRVARRLPRPALVMREVTGVGPRSFAQWVRDHRAGLEARDAR